jgi:hypothetical protein
LQLVVYDPAAGNVSPTGRSTPHDGVSESSDSVAASAVPSFSSSNDREKVTSPAGGPLGTNPICRPAIAAATAAGAAVIRRSPGPPVNSEPAFVIVSSNASHVIEPLICVAGVVRVRPANGRMTSLAS